MATMISFYHICAKCCNDLIKLEIALFRPQAKMETKKSANFEWFFFKNLASFSSKFLHICNALTQNREQVTFWVK